MVARHGTVQTEEKSEEPPSEHDNMDLDMLQEVVPMLEQQKEKAMLDRNYVQLERVRETPWPCPVGCR